MNGGGIGACCFIIVIVAAVLCMRCSTRGLLV